MLVGSRVFFSTFENFNSKDIDKLEIIENPQGFSIIRQFKFPNKCVFQWKKMSVDEFIDITLQRNFPMEVGKFLVPDFIKELNVTIKDIKRLKPLIENLDEKHLYEKVIYDSYIENNDFFLTDEQLNKAYEIYLKYRQ